MSATPVAANARRTTLVDQYGNPLGQGEKIVLLPQAVRAATTTSLPQLNNGARGVILWVWVSAISGLGIVPRIQGIDPNGSGLLINLEAAVPAAITATGLYAYSLYPTGSGIALTATTNGPLPRDWQVRVTHNDGNNVTYMVTATTLP